MPKKKMFQSAASPNKASEERGRHFAAVCNRDECVRPVRGPAARSVRDLTDSGVLFSARTAAPVTFLDQGSVAAPAFAQTLVRKKGKKGTGGITRNGFRVTSFFSCGGAR